MGKVTTGLAMLGGAVALGAAAFFDPALVASPFFDKALASLAIGGITSLAGAVAGALTTNQGTSVTVRQPAAYRPIVYGTRQVGGSLIYASTTGGHHDQFNMIIVLAGHEINAIESLYLDGRKVFFNTSSFGSTTRNGVTFGGDANSTTYSGPDGSHYNFGGLVFCEARFGDQVSGDVMSSMTANDSNWSAGPNGSPWVGGCAYVYLKVEYNANMFPSRPEIRFTVQGKNDIYDPRTNSNGFTDNWALCVADVMTNPVFGIGVDQSSINTAQLIAAANVCDEQIPLANIVTEGVSESRYTCNWTGDTSSLPGDILSQIMPAGGGSRARLSKIGGQWFIWPAYWQGPAFEFSESSLTGPVHWEPNRSIRDLVNRVKGTYIAPWFPYAVAGNLYDKNGFYDGTQANLFNLAWQPNDFPFYAQDVAHGYTSDQWLTEDGGVLRYKDLNQSACISLATCQRIAKIELLSNRFQGSGTLPMMLDAYQMQPVDVMGFTLPMYSWTNKLLEVTKVSFSVNPDNGAPVIAVNVDVAETDPSIYEWSVTEEQTIYDVPALPSIPPYVVDAPTGLTLSHQSVNFGGDPLHQASGSGILVSWTPSDDAYVIATAVQYQVTGATMWTAAGSVPQGNTQFGIAPLASGSYTVGIYAVRANGATSAVVTATITF